MNENTPDEHIISREPFPASRKVYVRGQLHDIQVAMREITVGNTVDRHSDTETSNLPVTVYDTSGPYTDASVVIDLQKGLSPLRERWIVQRGDVEGNPRKAKTGRNVTQLHYAKQGIITPEMEYIAIRENQRGDMEDLRQHEGQPFGANIPKGLITPEFVRQEVAAGRAVIPANINHPETEP
ncbi:MAG TPA: phosphomethylpyrimidine synthase ThiC, partial [Puia sp.]|nr:phosphomethylpyrimidine synthase ThiC [Puia sp.]